MISIHILFEQESLHSLQEDSFLKGAGIGAGGGPVGEVASGIMKYRKS